MEDDAVDPLQGLEIDGVNAVGGAVNQRVDLLLLGTVESPASGSFRFSLMLPDGFEVEGLDHLLLGHSNADDAVVARPSRKGGSGRSRISYSWERPF